MLRVKNKNGEYKKELSNFDLKKEFDEFNNSFAFDKKALIYDNKRKWAKDISEYLVFERSHF
jgi:hypothetical protein